MTRRRGPGGKPHDVVPPPAPHEPGLYKPAGRPQARERTSQKAQLKSGHRHGTYKARRTPMQDKLGRPGDQG